MAIVCLYQVKLGETRWDYQDFFSLHADSFGNIGTFKNYRDPSLEDHALLDGRSPIMFNTNNFIAFKTAITGRRTMLSLCFSISNLIQFYIKIIQAIIEAWLFMELSN